MFDRVHLHRRAFFDAVMEGLTPEEMATLDRLLLTMARNADRIAQERVSAP